MIHGSVGGARKEEASANLLSSAVMMPEGPFPCLPCPWSPYKEAARATVGLAGKEGREGCRGTYQVRDHCHQAMLPGTHSHR